VSRISQLLKIPFLIGGEEHPAHIAIASERQAQITIQGVTMAWHEGDIWEPVATITNPQAENPDEPVEPGSVTFTFRSYKGVETAGTATKVTVGVWKSSIELTEAGEWSVSVQTTAPYKASQPATIPVKPKFNP
jgi:hypothetical protein